MMEHSIYMMRAISTSEEDEVLSFYRVTDANIIDKKEESW